MRIAFNCLRGIVGCIIGQAILCVAALVAIILFCLFADGLNNIAGGNFDAWWLRNVVPPMLAMEHFIGVVATICLIVWGMRKIGWIRVSGGATLDDPFEENY
jgi:amino acid transporter